MLLTVADGADNTNTTADAKYAGYVADGKILSTGVFYDVAYADNGKFSSVLRETPKDKDPDDDTPSGNIGDVTEYVQSDYQEAAQVHQYNTIWRGTAGHLISGASVSGTSVSGRGYRGQVGDCDPCSPCGFGSDKRTAWVNYVGRGDTVKNQYQYGNKWSTGVNGIQVGLDLFRTNQNQFGVFFGYEGGEAKSLNTATLLTDKIEADNSYVGIYGVHVFENGADGRVLFNYGWQGFDSYRSVNTTTFNTSSYGADTAELTLELGKRVSLNRSVSFRPAFGVDFFVNNIDEAKESGVAPLTFSKSSLTQMFLRAGSDLQIKKGRATLTGLLYYSYDVLADQWNTMVSQGDLVGTLSGFNDARNLLTYNIGCEYDLTKVVSVFGGYQGDVRLDGNNEGTQHTGYAGIAWKW